jgi:hypothetical protein
MWPCKAYEIKTAGLSVDSLSIENFLVISTQRKNHFRVIPRENNKHKFWTKTFELYEKGNLSSLSLKSFKYETKTFYDSISLNNFDFNEAVTLASSAENVQIFSEISEF